MKGVEAYVNKYDGLARKRIAKSDNKSLLTGFYNYLVINKSYSSAYVYLSYIIYFLDSVDDINKIDIDSYNAYLASIKHKSQNAQIDAYHALQKYSKYLKAKGICEDYMQYVDRPKFFETQETKEKREHGYLTKAECKKMINYALTQKTYGGQDAHLWNLRDYAVITIFLTTGIRCSALYKMDVNDVNLVDNTITVFEKGNKARKIVISSQVAEIINEWLIARNTILNGKKEECLIISKRKRRMEAESIAALIRRVSKNATGRDVSPHKLRATYGTNLYKKTRDIHFVQKNMGHSDPRTTELYIRGNINETSQQAAKIMDSFLD